MIDSIYLDLQRAALARKTPPRTINRPPSSDRNDWVPRATCRQHDPDALYVQGAHQRQAAAVCRQCPVRQQCLATSLDNREEFGVWGGLTERQRRALLRKNTHIDNWADHLAAGGELSGI